MSGSSSNYKYKDLFTRIIRTKKIIWIPLLMLFLLSVIEITFSLVYSKNNKYFVKDKNSTREIVFNTALLTKYYNGITSVPYNYCTTFKKEKTKNSYRVFLLGEASLSGWPYSTERSVQKRIEKIIGENKTNRNVEIITISMAGFNSSLALDLIPQIIKYNPDLIFLYAGHNEFYGYKGYTETIGKSEFFLIDAVEDFLIRNNMLKSIGYDSYSDDLEVLLPMNSNEQILDQKQNKYKKIKDRFYSNILEITSLCKEHKTNLVLSALPDNYFLPPIGVTNEDGNVSADITYNNARMALMRDGDQNTAVKLFEKAKDMDAFRLRIPEEFFEILKRIAKEEEVSFADIKSEFISRSINCVPGNEYFLDYIHPNSDGLDIVAYVYSQAILKSLKEKTIPCDKENLFWKVDPFCQRDSVLAIKRINKSMTMIKQYSTKLNGQEISKMGKSSAIKNEFGIVSKIF